MKGAHHLNMAYTWEDISALLPFWGHPPPFTVDGVEYRTAEQHMMAEKARLMGSGYIPQDPGYSAPQRVQVPGS